jgi:hypothetical protein
LNRNLELEATSADPGNCHSLMSRMTTFGSDVMLARVKVP